MDKSRIVLYHSPCIDGFTAAWVAWLAYGDQDTEYIGLHPGDPMPDVTGKEALIVDISFPRKDLLEANEKAKELLLLDHHKTAEADLKDLPFVVFDMERSGAGLAWDVLHSEARPWLVQYVEDRDLWRFRLPQSKEVNSWISACRHEKFSDWTELSKVGVVKSAIKGEAVTVYINRYVREMTRESRLITFEGHTVPIVNAPYICISELVSELAKDAPFAIGWFQRGDGLYSYSLRSLAPNGLDVSEIAKRYGGGGHRHSAGFALKERINT